MAGALEKFIVPISTICTYFIPASLFCLIFQQFCQNTITKLVILFVSSSLARQIYGFLSFQISKILNDYN